MTQKPVVVVTGASRRLGLFLCEHFLKHGFFVAAITRAPSETLKTLCRDFDLEIFTLSRVDIQEVESLVVRITRRYAKIRALIHNASIFKEDKAVLSMDEYFSFFQVHMQLPVLLNEGLRTLLDDKNEPGCIIHITDIFSENPNPSFSLYCSTKAGLENLSKSYAKKYAPGIRVNTVQPGPIQFLDTHSKAAKASVLNESLLPFEGGFMPIFQAAVSVIENSYITGSAIKVDGGRSLGRG